MKKIIFYVLFVLLIFISNSQAQTWEQVIKAVSSDRQEYGHFGYGISISGDYAIVGAYLEALDENSENSLSDAGAAYILFNNGTTWTQQQKIVASDRAANDWFGKSVAIAGDYAVVAASGEDEDATGNNTKSQAGSAYVFKRSGSTWSQQQKIVASDRAIDDVFGSSVSISGDYIIVGANNEDEDASNSNTLASAGSAYIFFRSDTTWNQQQKIVASDRATYNYFGDCVDIAGDYSVVGAYNHNSGAGAAYIFIRSGTTWSQQQKIIAGDGASNDNFGKSVAISGSYVIAGSMNEDEDASGSNTLSGAGSSYIFYRSGTTWSQQQKIVASDRGGYANDHFGSSVDISGNIVIIGADGDDEDENGENEVDGAGSAYIFTRDVTTWTEQQKIVPSIRAIDDAFGECVAISGDTIIVGVKEEDEDAGGSNTLTSAGAIYVFETSGDVPLSISLLSFTAVVKNGKVELAWQTASETNNAHFLIYRNNEVVASVSGIGTTTKSHNYNYTDCQTIPGEKYIYILADVSYANEETKYIDKAVLITIPENDIPQEFALEDNYPNPFNPITTIEFDIPSPQHVRLQVFDVIGRLATTLFDGFKEAGHWNVKWNAGDYSSGIYIYRLEYGDKHISRKMLLMK